MSEHFRICLVFACLILLHSIAFGENKTPGWAPTHKLPPEVLNRIVRTCKEKNTFAVTLDDGPWVYQNDISDYLSARGIKGTFFINGYNWECIYNQTMVDRLRRTFSQGHVIAAHTWSHPHIVNLTEHELIEQLDLLQIALRKILGIEARLFRAPYGGIDKKSLDIIEKREYKVIDWDFDSGDANDVPAPQSIEYYDEVARTFPTPHIALNHENYNTTAFEVIPHAVSVLQKAGYKLVSVPECLGYGTRLEDLYQYVGKPQPRDKTWTCKNTPKPGPN